MKSHYLGAFTDSAASINVKRNNWTLGNFSSYSKYGGTGVDTHGARTNSGSVVICESCHSVLHNAGTGAAADSGALLPTYGALGALTTTRQAVMRPQRSSS